MLLGVLVTTTGIGHAHLDASASSDTCAVCVHARSVAVAPEVAVTIDPVELALPAASLPRRAATTGRVRCTNGRAPPVSTSSSC